MTSRQIFKRWKIRRGSAVQNLLPQNYHFSCSDWERETHSLEDQGSTSLIKSYQHYSTIIVLAKFVVFIYSGILKILCPNVSLELEIRYGPQSLQSDDPAHQNFFYFIILKLYSFDYDQWSIFLLQSHPNVWTVCAPIQFGGSFDGWNHCPLIEWMFGWVGSSVCMSYSMF